MIHTTAKLPFILVDMETTGLDPRKDHMLEIGLMSVDPVSLTPMNTFQSLVITPESSTLIYQLMTQDTELDLASYEFITGMHSKNGLFNELDSIVGEENFHPDRVSARAQIWLTNELKVWHNRRLEFAEANSEFDLDDRGRLMAERKEKPPMFGSSVNFDYEECRTWMPELWSQFHYRIIDNSSIKELFKVYAPWFEENGELPTPMKRHRVIPDLYDTLAEFKVYKTKLFGE